MVQLVDKYTSKLKRCFVYIGQHTMFVLGTQYLGFKVGNMLQILFQGRNINWLELYGVSEDENYLLFMWNFAPADGSEGKRYFCAVLENEEI